MTPPRRTFLRNIGAATAVGVFAGSKLLADGADGAHRTVVKPVFETLGAVFEKRSIYDAGTVHLYLRNRSSSPRAPVAVAVRETESKSGDLALWVRMTPPVLAPGERGEVRVKLLRGASQGNLVVTWQDGAGDEYETRLRKGALPLRLESATVDRVNGRIVAYVHNHGAETIQLTSFSVDVSHRGIQKSLKANGLPEAILPNEIRAVDFDCAPYLNPPARRVIVGNAQPRGRKELQAQSNRRTVTHVPELNCYLCPRPHKPKHKSPDWWPFYSKRHQRMQLFGRPFRCPHDSSTEPYCLSITRQRRWPDGFPPGHWTTCNPFSSSN